jgi:hypothetical protein
LRRFAGFGLLLLAAGGKSAKQKNAKNGGGGDLGGAHLDHDVFLKLL